MASLRNNGPLRSLIVDAEEPQATNAELLTPPADFVPDESQTFTGGDFQRGLQSGTRQVEAGSYYRQADKAERDGDLASAQALREHARTLELGSEGFAPRVGSTADVKGVGDAIDFAQGGLGQLAPTILKSTIPAVAGGIAGGIVAGPVGAFAGAAAAGGAQSFELEAGEAAASQQADEFIRQLPVEERLREQRNKGLQGAALELAFPTLVGGRLASGVGKVFRQIGKQAAETGQRRLGREVLKETGVEAATEASQTAVGQASLSRLNPNRDTSGDLQELIDATVLGALGGGGISLGTSVPSALASSRIRGRETDDNGDPKPGAGERIADSILGRAASRVDDHFDRVAKRVDSVAENVLDRAAETGEKVKTAVQESDLPFIYGNVKAAAKRGADAVTEAVSDSELARRARLRKSAFGPTADVDVSAVEEDNLAAVRDFVASQRFATSAEEIGGLRELQPISGKEQLGQRRRVQLNTRDVDAHLKGLVERGTITQEVADSAKVEPLGENMKRKGASVQEMENEIAAIVRDLMTRIENNKGSKEDRADFNKGLMSELQRLPVDVQRRGERTFTNTENTSVTEETRTEQRRKSATKDQNELFPGDVGKSFPVEIKEFKRNHFGLSADIVRDEPQQLELGLKKEGETYQDLLVRALNQYGVVLASDAAADSSAASPADTKARRAGLDTGSKEDKAGRNVLRLKLKNGRTELLDAESLAQAELARDREGVVGNVRGVARQQEAARLSALASELLRNDVEGLIDPATGKVVKGAEANEAFQAFLKGKPKARRVVADRERRATGGFPTKSAADVANLEKRSEIQRAFTKARKDLLENDSETNNKLRKSLQSAAKAQRATLQKLREMQAEFVAEKQADNNTPAMVKALKTKYGPEVTELFESRAKAGTAKFRADRLEALVADINELRAEEKAQATGLAEEAEGGRAETLEETGVRFAEEQTGAGDQLRVGTPFRGSNRSQRLTPEAAKTQREKAARQSHEQQMREIRKQIEAGERVVNVQAKNVGRILNSKAVQKFLQEGGVLEMSPPSAAARTDLHLAGLKEKLQPGGRSAWMLSLAYGNQRFSQQNTQGPASLLDALSNSDRAARRKEVKDYLAKVLGPAIAAKFSDVLAADTDVAGSFDWKTSVIELAIDATGYMGLAKHESFHAFFHNMGKIDNDRAVYNRLLRAANAPHIKRQLRKLLAGNDAALKQLRDPEERLAYMFQFYSSGQLRLQPNIAKTFRDWARKLAELVGYVSKMDTAERIFQSFESGNLKSNWDIRNMVAEEQHTGLTKNITSVTRPVGEAMRAVVSTATDRLRATNNLSLRQIADLFASEVKRGGQAGFLSLRAQREAQFRNELNDILEKHNVSDEKTFQRVQREALAILQGQQDAEAGSLAADVRDWMQKTYKYLRDPDGDVNGEVSPNAVRQITGFKDGKPVWKPIKDSGPLYFPRVWDAEAVLQNWDEFKALVAKHGGPDAAALDSFRQAMQSDSDGMLEIDNNSPTFDAAMRAINSRTFTFITPENAGEFVRFQQQDLGNILTTYARQAAHRGEQTRHFGYNNQKVEALLADAREEGATPKELETADKAIRALQGTLGADMSQFKKNAMMTAMTAVNFAVLPLALFSSLVDPLGVLVRTGSIPAAGKTFAKGTKQIIADIRGKKTDGQKLAEFLGIVEQEQMLSVVGDTYNSMFMNETLRKANARFFKIIGLDSWTKGTRIGAMQASFLYLRDNATNAKALDELGLQAGDIQMREDTVVETRPEVLGSEKARRVQGAIFRMVDESILRPSAAQRPIFMSDMRFVLLGHLKQFTFSFHNTIVKQVAQNISDNIDNQQYVKAVQAFAPLMAYVPFMMAADFLRAAVGGRLDDQEDRDFFETFENSVQRSAVLGVYTFGLDAGDDLGYGGLPINTFLGPVIAKGTRLAEAGIDPDERFTTAAVKMLPGWAFWKGWIE